MHFVHSSINMMPLTIIKFNIFTFGNAKSFLPSLLYNFNEVQLLPQCISGRKKYSQQGKCLNSNYCMLRLKLYIQFNVLSPTQSLNNILTYK